VVQTGVYLNDCLRWQKSIIADLGLTIIVKNKDSNFNYITDSSVWGGILMMLVALVWVPCRPWTMLWLPIWQFIFWFGLVGFCGIIVFIMAFLITNGKLK